MARVSGRGSFKLARNVFTSALVALNAKVRVHALARLLHAEVFLAPGVMTDRLDTGLDLRGRKRSGDVNRTSVQLGKPLRGTSVTCEVSGEIPVQSRFVIRCIRCAPVCRGVLHEIHPNLAVARCCTELGILSMRRSDTTGINISKALPLQGLGQVILR